MRFLAFQDDGGSGLALETEKGFRGLRDTDDGFPGTLDDIVRRGPEAFAEAASALSGGIATDPAKIRFAVPFARASKILCIGLNYADHSAESNMELPDYPVVFGRFASGLVPHGQPLVCPKQSDKFDYEGEVVAVIGKAGRHISREAALDHVAGYSVFNDGSVRDYQLRTPQWTVGKNFDATGGFGPYFVTADALPAGAAGLRLQTILNGEIVQSASTDDLVFSVADLVSLLSEAMTLEPGDLIVTGTPAGVGAARKPPLFMKPGDLCEVEVEGIGRLSNPIIAELA